MKGTVEAADGEATEALGLGGEGAESGVDVGVRKRKHVGIGGDPAIVSEKVHSKN